METNASMTSVEIYWEKKTEDKHSAGTADWYSPGFKYDEIELHKKYDVYPFEWAKELGRIDDYYKVRPHIWYEDDENRIIRINDSIFKM